MCYCLRVTVSTLAIVLGMAGCSHFHGHAAHGNDHTVDRSALVLNEGKKWPTDAPLRAGMKRIRALGKSLQVNSPASQIEASKRQATADGVQEQVAFLIANCKLEPKADAALHVLVSDMLGGAEKLRNSETAVDGANSIRAALQQYPTFFDDPEW